MKLFVPERQVLSADPLPSWVWSNSGAKERPRAHGESRQGTHGISGVLISTPCALFNAYFEPGVQRGIYLLGLHQLRTLSAGRTAEPLTLLPAKIGISHVYNLFRRSSARSASMRSSSPCMNVLHSRCENCRCKCLSHREARPKL